MSDLAWRTDVQLACSGDREAFARLIRGLQNEMYKMAHTLLSNDEDCADAIQETILKSYVSLPKLREQAYFRTWLFRILINECQRIYRKSKRISSAEGIPDQEVRFDMPDLDLHAAVNRLDEPLRTIVKLHYFADLPLAQVAEMLDVSEGTLKSRLHRARQKMASWLSESEKGRVEYEY